MNLWKLEGFDREHALDFVERVTEEKNDEVVRDTLAAVAEADAAIMLNQEMLIEALAAAELVAAIHGYPSLTLPEEAQRAAPALEGAVDQDDANLARSAILGLRERTEAQKLWADRDPVAWHGALDDLLGRLAIACGDQPL
ncbi:MAG: DUF4259 domain-containing protein [Candidatus Promineifilaceae bacterium]|nr:DUF4259 domain-containing protein [Candidatus Promineifilaceae bacterium]